ncbi:MAG TPA: hypothetical protein VNM87_01370 [Candidatus Udaeobacter sp.]|nr:hypothetical protein [Candidatus Udaeobacter sp.]
MRAGRGRTWTCRLGLLGIAVGLLLGQPACRPNRTPDSAPAKVAPEEIVYELHGGFAGFDLVLTARRGEAGAEGAKLPADETVVEEKGRIVRGGQLGPEGWAGLEELLRAANLPRLRPQYGQEGAVSDAMTEVVTVRVPGQDPIRVATISDPRDEPPAEFRVLTERLRELALTLPAR